MSSSIWRKQFFDGSLASSASRVWNWYRAELIAFLPPATLAFLLDRGERRLLARAGEPLRLLAEDGDARAEEIFATELSTASLDDALERRGATRAATKVVLEIPRAAFFIRRFDAPALALAELQRLLAAEIERRTPFSVADVLHGHVVAPSPLARDKIVVEQWIVRRDLLPRFLDGSGLSIDDLDLVQPQGRDDDPTAIPTLAVGRAADAPHWERRAGLALAIVAAALFFIGLSTIVWRQEIEASTLDADIAEASRRAATARKIADQATAESRLLATLRDERAKSPSFADLWEEVSRLLPDSAFVTEFRLVEDREGERAVELVGLAESAASLPALFDRSALFADAKLTAPITPDPIEKRESFSLQAKVRRGS